MNALAQAINNTATSNITVKLVGQNFTTGEQYFGRPIALNFFEKALENGHEIEVQSLDINGFHFYGDHISGYNELHAFLQKANDEDQEYDLGVIHALLMERGLTDLKSVYDFADNHVITFSLNSEEFGLSDLREQYGQERSDEELEAIALNLPKSQREKLHIYWNHQQYTEDLFINECKFISNGKVQVVISNR